MLYEYTLGCKLVDTVFSKFWDRISLDAGALFILCVEWSFGLREGTLS